MQATVAKKAIRSKSIGVVLWGKKFFQLAWLLFFKNLPLARIYFETTFSYIGQ